MPHPATFIHPLVACLLAPLLLGVITRVKARAAGRRGAPLIQPYHDLARLLRKGTVYSTTATALVRLGPVASLAAIFLALLLVPLPGLGAAVAFPGDLAALAGLLALARLATVLAALDTGSPFEGMGASRELFFGALAEPALLVALTALARAAGSASLTPIYAAVTPALWLTAGPALLMVGVALLVVALAENARVPVDDPLTHLELTMIHEAMVLDHAGPDLAFIDYGAALKLWLTLALVAALLPLRTGTPWIDAGACVLAIFTGAAVIGVIESSMARLRLVRVPQLLVGAAALAGLAAMLTLR